MQPENSPETFESDMNKTSSPVSPENSKPPNGLLMGVSHVLLEQPGDLKGALHSVHWSFQGQSLD